MNDYSSILFARPSFLEGMARCVDLGGTLQEYNVSPSGEYADAMALDADWRAVGADISGVLNAEQMKRGQQRVTKEKAK